MGVVRGWRGGCSEGGKPVLSTDDHQYLYW